jgi:hypothetical protein
MRLGVAQIRKAMPARMRLELVKIESVVGLRKIIVQQCAVAAGDELAESGAQRSVGLPVCLLRLGKRAEQRARGGEALRGSLM